jgi:ATP-dependent Clp protease ATP-binding subunit ClpC
VLLDEIEKAHNDVFNLLLQIMEEGRLTDSLGHSVDFKNTIIIMTTNLGAEALQRQSFGLQPKNRSAEVTYDKMKEQVMQSIEKAFRPEFLGRLSDVIVFHGLMRADLERIIDLELKKVKERLLEKNIELTLSQKAREFVMKKGYNPDSGARPLRRAIENFIEEPLSEELLRGVIKDNCTLSADVEEPPAGEQPRKLVFTVGEVAPPAEPPAEPAPETVAPMA